MKKINKIIVMVLMVALSIGSFFISPISAIVAATATVGAAFTLSKLPTTAKINDTVKIPKGKTNESGASVSVIVKDPSGKDVTSELTDKGDYYELTPNMVGNYKVGYYSSGEGFYNVYSNEYIIKVTGVKPTLSFADNNEQVVPKKLAYKQDRAITLPSPLVKQNQDEEEDAKVLGQVKASDVSEDLKNHTMSLSDVETLAGYSILAKDSKQNSVTVDYVVKDIKIQEEDGEVDGYQINFTVTPNADTFGTYRVTYMYQNAVGMTASKSLTFEVKKNYEETTELSFKWKDGKEIPTTASCGDEVTLPVPAVTDTTGESVNVFTNVEVYYVPAGKLESKNDWINIAVKDFKFDTSYKANNGACYIIKYTITDFFGNKIEKQYSMDNVTDKINPKVYAVADYSTENAQVDTEKTKEDMFPTYVAVNQSVTLPAIYATDNISKVLNVEESDKEITLTRRVVFNSTSTTFSSATSSSREDYVITNTDDGEEFNDNNEVKFTPKKTGEYVIYYEASDKSGNSATSIKKTITVVENYEDSMEPEITVPVLSTVAYAGDTIKFDAPTAKDYGMIDGEKKLINAELPVAVKYNYVYQNDSTSDKTDLVVNKDGSYSFNIPTEQQIKKVVITMTATDNARYQKDSNVDNTKTETIEIEVINVENDTTSPVLKTTSFANQTFGQVEDKTIQTVTFEDESPLSISVKVDYEKDSSRQSIAVFNGTTSSENNQYTLSGATFNSANVGEHIVTFTAVDSNGNMTIVSYKLSVERTVKPQIVVSKANDSTMELGSTITLNAGQLKDYGGNVVDGTTVNIRLISGSTATASLVGNKLTAKSTGVIRYEYYCQYNGEVYTSSAREITVQDTVAPTISFFENDIFADEWAGSEDHTMEAKLDYLASENGTLVKVGNEYVTYDANNEEHTGLTRYDRDKYANIEIPAIKVDDEDVDTYSVKVTSPSGKELLNSVDGDKMKTENSTVGFTNFYEFTPTGNGAYTIVYSATDKSGKSTTLTYSLQVGDCEDPVLALNDAQNVTTATVGDILKINLNVMELSDNIDSTKTAESALSSSDGLKLTITITTPDNETVSLTKGSDYYSADDKTFTYTLSNAGEYTVKYTLTDGAGRTDEQVKKITVKSVSSTNTTSEAVWGTILIVASVVLLGGVIVYFAVTNKKYSPKKKDKNEEK